MHRPPAPTRVPSCRDLASSSDADHAAKSRTSTSIPAHDLHTALMDNRTSKTLGSRRKRENDAPDEGTPRPRSPNENTTTRRESSRQSSHSQLSGLKMIDASSIAPPRSTLAPRAKSSRSNGPQSNRQRSLSRTRQSKGPVEEPNASCAQISTASSAPKHISIASTCPEPRGATLSHVTTSQPVTAQVMAEGQLALAGKARHVLTELRDGRSVPNGECGEEAPVYQVRCRDALRRVPQVLTSVRF